MVEERSGRRWRSEETERIMMSERRKGSNLKTREDEGRKKLQHKLGLEPAALYGTNRLASTKAN